MIHPDGFGAARPIDVPILLGADGPLGTAAARELADGMFSAGLPNPEAVGAWRALLQFGTVLDEGEAPDAPRVSRRRARRWPSPCTASTSGAAPPWSTACPAGRPGVPRSRAPRRAHRHLATHEGHLVELSARDRAALAAGTTAMIPAFTLTGTAGDVGARVAALPRPA